MNQMENRTDTDEIEINLTELCAYIVRHGCSVLLAAILFMLLLGGYKGYKNIIRFNSADAITEEQAAYQDKLELYNAQKTAGETLIENINEQLKNQQDYQEHSILMNIDPYNEYRDSISYYVYTNYQIMPGMDYQNVDPAPSILAAYAAAAQDGEMFSNIVKQMNGTVSVRDLEELISVDYDDDTSKPATRVLTITTIGNTQELANQLMSYVKEQINDSRDKIAASIGEHELRVITEFSSLTADAALQKKMTDYSNTIATLQQNLAKVQDSLSDLKEPAAPAGNSRRHAAMNTAKFAIIGLILGGFLAAMVWAVLYITGDRLSDEDELSERFGVTILGHIVMPGKKGFFAGLADRIRGIHRGEVPEVEQYAYLAECLKQMKEKPVSIAVVTDMNPENARAIAEKLAALAVPVSVIYSGNTASDAAALKAANQQEAVLLLADRDISTRRHIRDILQSCLNCEKKICGAIVVA